MVVAGRFYAIMLPAIDARLAEEMLGRETAMQFRFCVASLDELYSTGLLSGTARGVLTFWWKPCWKVAPKAI